MARSAGEERRHQGTLLSGGISTQRCRPQREDPPCVRTGQEHACRQCRSGDGRSRLDRHRARRRAHCPSSGRPGGAGQEPRERAEAGASFGPRADRRVRRLSAPTPVGVQETPGRCNALAPSRSRTYRIDGAQGPPLRCRDGAAAPSICAVLLVWSPAWRGAGDSMGALAQIHRLSGSIPEGA